MSDLSITAASGADLPVLREMLWRAFSWRETEPPPAPAQLPEAVERYVEGFASRNSDHGLVARDRDDGPAGAAWYRLLTGDERGYGFVDDETPEITVAVRPAFRRRRVGTTLVTRLLEDAWEAGLGQLSLSTEPENPALRLYERVGFVRVGENGGSWTMVAQAPADPRRWSL